MRFKITPNFVISTELFQFSLVLVPELTTGQVRSQMGEVQFRLPEKLNFHDMQVQEWLNRALIEAMRKQCRALLTPRLNSHAAQSGLTYHRVIYKDVRSRWGSCSSRQNLNFNVWLLFLPLHLADYVLCHELAHLHEMNHSAKFWAETDRILGHPGMARSLDRELNAFSRSLSQSGRYK